MSKPERTAPRQRRGGTGWTTLRVAITAVAALLLVLVGYFVGLGSTWTAHQPRLESGTAARVPAEVPIAYFDPSDGDRITFRLDNVVWKSGDMTDSGSIPPCLRDPRERVDVQVGLIEVARPYGSGSYQRVLSVTCPA